METRFAKDTLKICRGSNNYLTLPWAFGGEGKGGSCPLPFQAKAGKKNRMFAFFGEI
jgi:hypothetical protein